MVKHLLNIEDRQISRTLWLGLMIVMMVGCVPSDDGVGDEGPNVGSVVPEQVVVGNARWRGFLSNVTGYGFVLADKGLVDTIFCDTGYTTFEYRDEYRDPFNAAYDLVEMKVYEHGDVVRTVCVFNIGANGYAKEATETNIDTGKNYRWRFEYDQQGHLLSIDAGGDMCTFEYADGDLVEYINHVDADEDFSFTYSSLPSLGYMPYFHAPGYIEEDFGPILPMAYLAGLVGKPSDHLPAACEREQESNEYYWEYEYKYVFSNDGVLVGLYYQQL